ncbi:MAG: hypothetical protein ACPGQS_10005 [Bradymonadia bacterium]
MKSFCVHLAIGAVFSLILASCRDSAPSIRGSDEPSQSSESRDFVWREARELLREAKHAFYVRDAAYFGPGLPGWRSISGAGRKGVWSGGSLVPSGAGADSEVQVGAWMNGRAGSLRLPIAQAVDETGVLQFWFFGVVPKQAVSVFWDGKNVGTIDLSQGWRLYEVPLPKMPPGEHRLRFWFRRVESRRGIRTPGALGRLRIGGGNSNEVWPPAFDLDSKGVLSEPNGEWHFYLTDLQDARGRVALETSESAVQAQVLVVDDTNAEFLLVDEEVAAASEKVFNVQLPNTLSGGARVILKTKNNTTPVKWTTFKLERLAPRIELERPPEFKRLVFVLLDGVDSDDLRFDRAGAYPVTPTVDQLVSSGNGLPRVFTGGDTLSQRVERVMRWSESLMTNQFKTGQAALFSEVRLKLSSSTSEWINRYVWHKPDRFSRLLDEIEMWLKLQTSNTAMLTVVLSGQPKNSTYASVLAVREHATGADPRPTSIADAGRVTYLDQKLSRLLGLLSFTDSLNDTLIVVMGHKELRGKSLDLVEPRDFFSPLVVSTRANVFDRAHQELPSLDWVLSVIEPRGRADRSRNTLPRFTASRWTDPLTAILNGHWLLLLQDAKRYRLFRYSEQWENKKQTQSITQRAMRVLLDQQ